VVLQASSKALDEQVARLEDLDREIAILAAELERCAACSKPARKTAWRWNTKCASWPTIQSRQLAAFRGAAGTRPPEARCRTVAGAARAQSAGRGGEKEELREQREQELEDQRQELEKLEIEAAASAKTIRRHARSWPAWKSGIAPSAPPWAVWKQQHKEGTARLGAIAPEIERLGVHRAGLLADNIELDRKLARARRAGSCGPKPR
jgi:hypothetical protein